jgi:hypothetical protein
LCGSSPRGFVQKVDEWKMGSGIISQVGKGGLPPLLIVARLKERKAGVNRPSRPER